MLEFKTFSPEETASLGARLGGMLRPGDVVCLSGNLGTGKTAFTGGIASALGIKGYVTSPTFTLVNEYPGKIPLFHFDVYRIQDPDEMFEIGFEEYLAGGGVVVIEWADVIREVLPPEFIRVELERNLSGGNDARVIRISFTGEKYREYEKQLAIDN